jgi:hypothetical protein
MAGSLTIVAREIAKCTLDLVEAQEVRWENGSIQQAAITYISMRMTIMN